MVRVMRILIFSILSLILPQAYGQVISTNYPSASDLFLGGISFNVSNNSTGPIRVTTIESRHAINNPTQVATCRLWVRSSATQSFPGNITTSPLWTLVSTQTKTGVSTSDQPFLSNLAVDIPAGATYSFFVESNVQSIAQFIASPRVDSFVSAIDTNIKLYTGTNIGFSGPATSPLSSPRAFLGKVHFQKLTACSGTPVAGNIIYESGFCSGESKTYSLVGYTFGTGINIQWQQSTDGVTFTNIPGANNQNFITSNTNTIHYRASVTCTNSSFTTVSPSIIDTLRAPGYCTCIDNVPVVTSEDDEEIFEVSINGNARVSNCGGTIPGTSSRTIPGKYTDWMPSGPLADLYQGSKNLFQFNFNTCGTSSNARNIYVLIDINGNRTFDANELVLVRNLNNLAPYGELRSNITIPSDAGGGQLSAINKKMTVLMRVIYSRRLISNYCLPGTSTNATVDFGEVEDHLVNLVYTETCSGTPQGGFILGTQEFCDGEVSNLITVNSTIATNLTRGWEYGPSASGPWSALAGANGDTLSQIFSNTVYLRSFVTCLSSGQTSYSLPFKDSLKPYAFCACTPTYASTPVSTTNYLEDFTLQGHYNTQLNHLATGFETSPNRYSDYRFSFTKMPKINPLEPFSMSMLGVSTATTNAHAYVYLDTNLNGITQQDLIYRTFGSTTRVSNDPSSPLTINHILLNSTKTGVALLRVIYRNNTAAISTPCLINSTTDGETHDYLVELYRPDVDIRVDSIVDFNSGCNLGIKYIKVAVRNIGKTTVNPVMTYYIDDVVEQETFGPIEPGAAQVLTFSTPFDFNYREGIVKLKVVSNTPNDEGTQNNLAQKQINHFNSPPEPVIDNDTVCIGRTYSLLEGNPPQGYDIVWYLDPLGNNCDTIANNYWISNPTTTISRYASTAYFTSDSTGILSPINPKISFQKNLGIQFQAKKRLVILESVDVNVDSESDTLVVGLYSGATGNAVSQLLRRDTFITTGKSVHRLPLNYRISGTVGSIYRLIMINHKGLVIDTPTSSVDYRNLDSTYLRLISGSLLPSTNNDNRYPFFYNWKLRVPFCESPLVEVKSVVLNLTAPVVSLPSNLNICSVPLQYLNPGEVSDQRYRWNTGDSTAKLALKASGTYIVKVKNQFGCSTSDTSEVVVRASPVFELGAGAIQCKSGVVELKTGYSNAGYNHAWTPFGLNPTFKATTNGVYSVIVTNTSNNCSYSDTIRVKILNPETVSLGNDTTFCLGGSKSINLPTVAHRTYLWHDNSTQANRIFTQKVIAKVTITDTLPKSIDTIHDHNGQLITINRDLDTTLSKFDSYVVSNKSNIRDSIIDQSVDTVIAYKLFTRRPNLQCISSDSVTINVVDVIKPNIGDSILECNNDFVFLSVPQDTNKLYLWSTGDRTPFTNVNRTGLYTLTVVENGTICSKSDSVYIRFDRAPTLELGPNRNICNVSDTVTAQSGFDSYTWSGGTALVPSNKRLVTNTTNLTLTVSHSCGIQTDNINITFDEKPIPFSLPNDTIVCEPITLSVPTQPASVRVLWNNTITGNSLLAEITGTYFVSATNSCGAETDAVNVTLIEPPVAKFDIQKNNLFMIFKNQSTNANSYLWKYHDNTYDTLRTGYKQYDTLGEYEVTLVVTNQCNQSDSITKIVYIEGNSSSINSIAMTSAVLAPNPATTYLDVKWSNELSAKVNIIDISGRIVAEYDVVKQTKSYFRLPDLNSGLYMLQVLPIDGAMPMTHKFRVQKN